MAGKYAGRALTRKILLVSLRSAGCAALSNPSTLYLDKKRENRLWKLYQTALGPDDDPARRFLGLVFLLRVVRLWFFWFVVGLFVKLDLFLEKRRDPPAHRELLF